MTERRQQLSVSGAGMDQLGCPSCCCCSETASASGRRGFKELPDGWWWGGRVTVRSWVATAAQRLWHRQPPSRRRQSSRSGSGPPRSTELLQSGNLGTGTPPPQRNEGAERSLQVTKARHVCARIKHDVPNRAEWSCSAPASLR